MGAPRLARDANADRDLTFTRAVIDLCEAIEDPVWDRTRHGRVPDVGDPFVGGLQDSRDALDAILAGAMSASVVMLRDPSARYRR